MKTWRKIEGKSYAKKMKNARLCKHAQFKHEGEKCSFKCTLNDDENIRMFTFASLSSSLWPCIIFALVEINHLPLSSRYAHNFSLLLRRVFFLWIVNREEERIAKKGKALEKHRKPNSWKSFFITSVNVYLEIPLDSFSFTRVLGLSSGEIKFMALNTFFSCVSFKLNWTDERDIW